MPQLPMTSASPVLRTDFNDDATWEAICDEMQQASSEGFEARVELIDDRKFDGLSKQQLLTAVPKDYPHSFIIVVDRQAIAGCDRTDADVRRAGSLARRGSFPC